MTAVAVAPVVILTPSQIGQLSECGHCWQVRRVPCTPVGSHLARYVRVRRKGLMPAAQVHAMGWLMGVFTLATVIPDEVADSVPALLVDLAAGRARIVPVSPDVTPDLDAWPDLEEEK
jgi:hypothetical protein